MNSLTGVICWICCYYDILVLNISLDNHTELNNLQIFNRYVHVLYTFSLLFLIFGFYPDFFIAILLFVINSYLIRLALCCFTTFNGCNILILVITVIVNMFLICLQLYYCTSPYTILTFAFTWEQYKYSYGFLEKKN